jgi:hypothetical protein
MAFLQRIHALPAYQRELGGMNAPSWADAAGAGGLLQPFKCQKRRVADGQASAATPLAVGRAASTAVFISKAITCEVGYGTCGTPPPCCQQLLRHFRHQPVRQCLVMAARSSSPKALNC